MKIMHILPELEEGGVERLIPVFANGQSSLGHEVTVVSYGGKLTSMLGPGVRHIKAPVHRKNPFVGIACAMRLAAIVRKEKIQIVHAHSRVPAWICRVIKLLVPRVKYFFTAHAMFPRLYYGTWPITKADGVTCVSGTVLKSMAGWLPASIPARVVYNPFCANTPPWTGGDASAKHLLYLGRISKKKGPIFAVQSLARVKNKNWFLDVIGDGPAMDEMRETINNFGLSERVALHGFSNAAREALSKCDLLLFPSQEEGLPLTLIEALSSGAPVLSSDISAVRELTSPDGSNPGGELLPPADVSAWAGAIDRFLDGNFMPTLKLAVKLPTEEEMVSAVLDFYGEILNQ